MCVGGGKRAGKTFSREFFNVHLTLDVWMIDITTVRILDPQCLQKFPILLQGHSESSEPEKVALLNLIFI